MYSLLSSNSQSLFLVRAFSKCNPHSQCRIPFFQPILPGDYLFEFSMRKTVEKCVVFINCPVVRHESTTMDMLLEGRKQPKITEDEIWLGMVNRKEYMDMSIDWYIIEYIISICPIYQKKIYRYIWYNIGRNTTKEYFFLNKHQSSPRAFTSSMTIFLF